MYSVESPFNEEDLLNTLLETLRIQEGPSKQMTESFEKAVFKKLKKRRKKVTVGNVPANHAIFKTVLLEHKNVFLFRSVWTPLFQIRIICNLCEVVYL